LYIFAEGNFFRDLREIFGLTIDSKSHHNILFHDAPRAPASSVRYSTEELSYPERVQSLIELTRTTLTTMGQIALDDNPAVGRQIVTILNGEIDKAVQIGADYFRSVASGRFRRQASNGDKAIEGVGGVMAGANGKIANEKGQLSGGAQGKIDAAHKAVVDKCEANACKQTSAAINQVEGAQNERKG